MTFHLITIFPDIFSSYINESIIKRAREQGGVKIRVYDLRGYTADKHRTVDDTPYGGGPGMVMKIEPLYRAIQDIKNKIGSTSGIRHPRIVLTSAKGRTWNQSKASAYTKYSDVIIICGRYEGVDERITGFIDEEISIGDYVLTGGELPALAVIDSITRLLPGVLGNPDSLLEESFSNNSQMSNVKCQMSSEYPQYTKPEVFVDDEGQKHRVPEILLSGHHAEIKKWREQQTTPPFPKGVPER